MTKDRLTFRLTTDGDQGELFIEAIVGRFSGAGSAWFNLEAIEDQLAGFEACPISRLVPPRIQGGYYDSGELEEEHLFCSIVPTNSTGSLAFMIRLATPGRVSSACRFSFSGEFATDYEQARRFARELRALISQGGGSFVLYSES
ncbi:hypothetical protein [Methylocystis heyeri]|uniref:Uncharacterized protein n=1 Tax=Methylocystis heyeri TaxID=391905 RepID=A0A6B8KCP5_9HYPH|nr:hypothetical protein [Methylocystis heyeri]QGM46006.1 hypothetical protein H2LOC_009995 [Methylocystis heyeri]